MTVHLYTLCWNEADMLPFFFRHYDPWVDRYFVYDDGSTDGSAELLDAHPKVERRRFERAVAGSFVHSQRALQDEVWKASRGVADWVVVTALDEHLWCPRAPMADLLAEMDAARVTAVPALGYQMVADDLPPTGLQLCATRTSGAVWPIMSKLSVFRPDAVAETRFGPGRHTAEPLGEVRYPDRDELLLLHYKYVGFVRLRDRHRALRAGLGKEDEQFGLHYRWDEERLRASWRRFAARAVDVTDQSIDHHRDHEGPRWWRTRSA